jgi:hypothetical protein
MQNFTVRNISKTVYVSLRADSISDACGKIWDMGIATKSSKLIASQIDGRGGSLRVVRSELHTAKN